MKILVISQYFWPENFRINDVCLGLKERGHDVTVLTGKPNYPQGKYFEGYSWNTKSEEMWEGIPIHRSNLFLRSHGGGLRLFLNYFSFAFFASFKVLSLRGPFDQIFIFAPSPITVGIPGIVAKYRFKAPNFLWVQDLWPESIRIAGGIENKFILGVMEFMTKWIYQHTFKLLIQSPRFKDYLLGQQVPEQKITYYPFYAEGFYSQTNIEIDHSIDIPEGFKLVFAGNIGEAQSFDTLIQAAHMLKNKGIPITWLILGDGRQKEYVKSKIAELSLEDSFLLMGSFSPNKMPYFFSKADALVVSLKKSDIFSMTIPGKLQSYLACGRPLIGSLDGIGHEIIQASQSGFSAGAEDPEGLVEAILKLYHLSAEEKDELGRNGRRYFESEFERELLLTKLEQILQNA
ncbi:glycosyltransferase family 4 protein [Aquirufa salirivi]|uniref:Glycosyltransferase family 4 protein n=1 Tax=Aquirufa salirivi TaxID=3104729 RepID=A0ABW8RTM1_9BACT